MISDTAAARLETTRKLDAFYVNYRTWTNFTLGSCCSIPALTLLGGPTYILLWTDGPYFLLLLGFAGAWLFGGFVLLMASMAIDARVSTLAAQQFDATFPRDTPERALAVDILRARMSSETGQSAQTLLQKLGEIEAEDGATSGPSIEDALSGVVAGGDTDGVFVPIEDDGAPPPPAQKPEKASPPRLRYIPLEPERGKPDDEPK